MSTGTQGRRGGVILAVAVLLGCGGDGGSGGDPSLARLLRGDAPVRLTLGDTVHVSQGVRDYYEARKNRAAWLQDGELSDIGQQALRAVGQSEVDGLPPERYRYPQAVAILERFAAADTSGAELPERERAALLVELDMLVSEGMARYAQDLAQGTLDPKEAGLEWDIPREQAPQESVLNALETGRSPEEVLAQLRPRSPHYARFMEALARHRESAARGGWQQLPRDLAVKEGATDPGVALLRNRFLSGPDATEAQLANAGAARADYFDAQLTEAVKRFQERHSIEADGQLGARTLKELNYPIEDRVAELQLNMDRWRWLPHELGRKHVLVNVAGFELEVVDSGRVIEKMNVIVGKDSWKTPIFADTLEFLIVNPYWNVPASIMKDEIEPALARDPNYLARNDMERTSDGGVRQRPGPKNALGEFKFMFPNADNIYLHDTPADHLFSRTSRDFSHGCIRLERPRDLADLMVRTATKRSPAELDKLLATGSEQWIKLDEKIPIYILYFTTWVQEDGTVRVHHDVYGRDEQMEEQAAERLTA